VTITRDFLEEHKKYIKNELEDISEQIGSGISRLTISGLSGTSKYFIAHLISTFLKRPFIFVSDSFDSDPLLSDNFNVFSEYDAEIFEKKTYSIESIVGSGNIINTVERISALVSLENGKNLVIQPSALFDKTVPGEILSSASIYLSINKTVIREKFIDSLYSIGFRKSEQVEYPGQFSTRGAIVDIFSPVHKYPVRAEFLGDLIRSIRFFDPKTQKSTNKTDNVSIFPASEFIYREDFSEIQKVIYNHLVDCDISPNLRNTVLNIIEEKKHIEQLEWLSPIIYTSPDTILNHTNAKYLVFFDLNTDLETINKNLLENHQKIINSNNKFNKLIPESDVNFISHEDVEKQLGQFQSIYFNDLLSKSKKHIKFSSETGRIKSSKNQSPVKNFANKIERLKEDNYLIYVVTYNENEQNKLKELLAEYKLEGIRFYIGPLENGFILKDLKVAVFTENDISEKEKKTSYQLPEDMSSAFISSFSELKPGEYIVHKQFGIGIYRGLKKIDLNSSEGDFIECEYRGGDKIYVPVENLKLVQKFIGDGKKPSVDKLGSDTWKKTVKKVKKLIETIARELLELYAKRKTIKGFSFSKRDQAFREFELEFNYEETIDQARSIEEVIADMESDKPMDRLICGDVGFGKTEVALRAAFKASMDGKQVALLVPTTLLATQHYLTTLERLSSYPLNIDMISRFKTLKETREIIEKLKDGSLDIVIGTHRLLGNKIRFRDLGLVIIDEEHKFGVKHKEKLRALKEGVDVLSLSATPIPRSLQLSLADIRDISVIQSPPEGRLPVDVFVKNYDKENIREVVLKEINRGGSVFFINNRIETIFKVAEELKALIPEASVAVTHGRMKEQVLEKSIRQFINGDINLLITTAIVESGLDIQRANTIIVNDAHMFGLADLYQLKGRVGRGKIKAFAYFLIPSLKTLTPEALKRLTKISELQELGSGFKLALSDLEIRGAGNLFGEQQSGTISNVGLELYLELLQNAINTLKDGKVEEDYDPEIKNSQKAYIPESYVYDSSERLFYYKKISSLKTLAEIKEFRNDLKDRYGTIPKELKTLFSLTEIKVRIKKLRVLKLEIKERYSIMLFREDSVHFQKYKPSGKLTVYYDPKEKFKVLKQKINELSADN